MSLRDESRGGQGGQPGAVGLGLNVSGGEVSNVDGFLPGLHGGHVVVKVPSLVSDDSQVGDTLRGQVLAVLIIQGSLVTGEQPGGDCIGDVLGGFNSEGNGVVNDGSVGLSNNELSEVVGGIGALNGEVVSDEVVNEGDVLARQKDVSELVN